MASIPIDIGLFNKLPDSEQYGMVLDALKDAIKNEKNSEILALISTQLFELSEIALERSGVKVICEKNCQPI